MDLLWERWYPACVALLGALAVYWFGSPDFLRKENALMFLGALGAIAIGFTTSSLTILIAIEDRPIISWLRRAPGEKYKQLLSYMVHTITWWSVSLILAGSALFVDLTRIPGRGPMIVATLLIGLSVGGGAAWFRISRITVSLLRGDAALSTHRMHPEEPPVECQKTAHSEAA